MNPNAVAQLDTAIADITRQFQNLTSQMQSLSSSLQRLATAGFSATTEGNRLSYMWMLFTRQIAAVTLPVINFLIESLARLTEWFKGLSGDAQNVILKIGLIVVAFTALVPVITVLSAVLSPVAIALGALAVILYKFFTETDTGKVILDQLSAAVQWATKNWQELKNEFEKFSGAAVKIFQTLVASFTWFGIALMQLVENLLDYIPGMGDAVAAIKKYREETQAGLDLLVADIKKPIQVSGNTGKESFRPRQDVNPTGFGFESLAASYERITSAANKQDLARESLDVQKKQLIALDAIKEGVMKPMEVGMSVGGDF